MTFHAFAPHRVSAWILLDERRVALAQAYDAAGKRQPRGQGDALAFPARGRLKPELIL
jgi:hypothetical protein